MAKELLLSGQGLNAQQVSCCFWDYSNSCNVLQVYKNGGNVKERTLNRIGNDYIIAGDAARPLLHLWQYNSQEPSKNLRMVLPDAVGVLEVCPKSKLMAAGIGNKLHVWELCSGKLITVQQVHYQSITCIKFSSGGECLVVAGNDGMIVSYLCSVLLNSTASSKAQRDIGQIEPLYKRMDHPLGVTDMFMEKFGMQSRFSSVSLDSTMRIYQLVDGLLLLVLVFSAPLTAVQLDSFNAYVGNAKGIIEKLSLTNVPRLREKHVDTEETQKLIAHKGKITALALNMYNTRLASIAAEENCIILWDINSCQMLKRLELKSIPTNIKFILTSDAFFSSDKFKPTCIVSSIERTIEENPMETSISWVQNNDFDVLSDLRKHDQEETQSIIELLQTTVVQLRSNNIALHSKINSTNA